MRLVAGHAICACSWSGVLRAKDPCPACARPAIDRIDAGRLKLMRLVQQRPDAELPPSQASRMIRLDMIERLDPPAPPAPSERGRHKNRPRCRHAVTSAGAAVLAAASIAEQTRHDVAASVARHADIDMLIDRSSVGQGLRRIREQGIDAELEHLDAELHGAKS